MCSTRMDEWNNVNRQRDKEAEREMDEQEANISNW